MFRTRSFDSTHDLLLVSGWDAGLAAFLEGFELRHLQIDDWDGPDFSALEPHVGSLETLRIGRKYRPDALKSFAGCTGLRELRLAGDMGPLREAAMPTLATLSYTASSPCDLSARARLQHLTVEGRGRWNISGLPAALEHLEVNGVRLESLAAIPDASSLRTLRIHTAPLRDLASIGRFAELKSVDIYGARQLADVAGLGELARLDTLVLERAGEIANLALLGGIASLAAVTLKDMKLASIRFLEALPHLAFLDLGERGSVADGDLSFLLAMPELQRVHMKWLRHYNISREALERLSGNG